MSNSITYPQVNWVHTFRGEKYDLWCIQMKSIFISQGLWDLVQNGYEKPKDATEEASWDTTKKNTYIENQRRDHYALSLIYRGLDEVVLPRELAVLSHFHIIKEQRLPRKLE
ncbi:hypothetical protein RND81_03G020000 [Saponaria officinalis]|uniref:DUF4219 domain-containing protein n=1 Tax=Saponaria officinalis TaxID=3572 RepID=A0AAW1M3N9_SAPOF